MIKYGIWAIVLVGLCVAAPARGETNLLVILDGSNSMWGQIDGVAKIETAKGTLGSLVSDLPGGTNVGLMAYGHSAEGDCKNVELLSEIGNGDADSLSEQINAIQPKGKTPIAFALEQSKTAFDGLDGQNNHIVLVSDGVESCSGDPCAVAQNLVDAGLDVRAHVVGFGLSADESETLTCIATNTGGQYFDASDTGDFDAAIKQVAEITQKAPEPEPEPVSEVVFEDGFDGDALSGDWEVINENLDQYIVENGELLLIGTDGGGLKNPASSNIVKLLQNMPAGDWTVTLEFTPEYKSSEDQFDVGLYDSEEKFVAASLFSNTAHCCAGGHRASTVLLRTKSVNGDNSVHFDTLVSEPAATSAQTFEQYVDLVGLNVKTTLQFIKEGRSYRSRVTREGQVDDAGAQIWVETEPVTSLRAPKHLVINAAQWEANSGETLFLIDSVKIEKN